MADQHHPKPKPVRAGLGTARVRRMAARLAEALFPAGERLPAPDSRLLVESVAGMLAKNPALDRTIQGLLWWLELRYFASHGTRFSSASRAARSAFLREHGKSLFSGTLLRVLAAPLRTAYLLDEQNLSRMNARHGVRVPSAVERARFHAQVSRAEDLAGSHEIECDVVVIGTGAGGAVAACELAEQGHALVMIEEGHYYGRPDFNGKLTEVVSKLYRAPGAIVALGNNVIPIPIGRSVGGTTTVNCGTCLRPPDATLADWRAEGLHDFTPENLEPYLTRVERILKVQPADSRYVGEIEQVIRRGAERIGLSQARPLLRNTQGCDGQGLCQFGCPTDAKQSTNVSFVPRALERGARLYTGFRATELVRANGRVTGVVARGAGAAPTRLSVKARATIVAMGALLTPNFLRENGVKNPNLGAHLSIHPAGAVLAFYPERHFENGSTIQQGMGIYDLKEEGLMFEGGTYPFFAHGFVNPLQAEDFVRFTERYQQTAYFGFMVKDTSRGRVRPGWSADLPLITYRINPRDFALFKRGIDLLSRVHFAAGASEVMLPSMNDILTLRSVAELDAFWRSDPKPRRFLMSAYHPLGTARIATHVRRGVCDPQHAVWGQPGLYVMDGSSVPSSLGANPQITIMAMAMRAASALSRSMS